MSQSEWDMDGDTEEKPFNKTYFYRMLGYLKPHKKVMSVVSMIVLAGMILGLTEPLLIRYAIDHGMLAKNIAIINLIAFVLIAFRLLGWLTGYWQTRLINFTGQRILYELRQQLFNHLQNLSFRFFDGRPAGKIMSRITNDTNAIGELINGGLITLLMESTHLVGIIVILLWMNWKLALASFSVLPFLYLMVVKLRPMIEGAWSRQRKTMSVINGNVNETIQGIRVIQAFSRQNKNNIKFKEINNNNRNAFMRAISFEATVWPLVELIGMLGSCIVIWYGAVLVIDKVLTIGFIFAFISYLWRFWGPLSSLSKVYSQLLSAMASSERIFEIMDTEPEVKDSSSAHEMPKIQGHVRFDHVSFSYSADKPNVIHDLSFEIKPGQRVALVGPTGAGKSTIVNMLMRFYDPTQGKVLIDAHDLKEVTLSSLRGQIGIVLQDSFIFSGTIEDNLRYGKHDASEEEMLSAARSVRIDRFVENFPDGYSTEVEERGSKLSVGQRQLLAFGRVLLADPRLLILDEATSSVDTETEKHIQEALKTVLEGRTAFIIAHRLSTVKDADLILVIEDGKICESGTHDELLNRNGLYSNLYYNQLVMQQNLTLQAI